MRIFQSMHGHVFALVLVAFSFTAAINDFERVVTQDVAIIGGGTTGSFAATWLLDHNLSFAVIERQPNLGGHSQTIYDEKGNAIEYGNVFFENTTTARSYFARYSVDFAPLPAVDDPAHPIRFYDLTTGEHVEGFAPPGPEAAFTALQRRADYVEQHFPFLEDGYYLPDPVPEELLMPVIDFIKRHQLQDVLNIAFQVAQGFGDFLHAPTLYAAKILSPTLLRKLTNNDMLVLSRGNAELYKRSLADFTQHSRHANMFLSSRVTQADRRRDAQGYVSLVVEEASGRSTTIRAKHLLITIPPTTANLAPFLDLDARETAVLSHLACNYYWTGVLRDARLPAHEVQNCHLANPGGVPSMPGSYVFEATPSPRLHSFWYGAPAGAANQTREGVLGAVKGEMGRLHAQMGFDVEAGKELDLVGFGDFGDFACMVDAEAIRGGFYQELYALQGYRDTWWTGAAWHTHDASLLWDFTVNVLESLTEHRSSRVLAGLKPEQEL